MQLWYFLNNFSIFGGTIRYLIQATESNASNESNEIFSKNQLEYWGIPKSVSDAYAQEGITELYPWQIECLEQDSVLNGQNLVYSAPTSSGKSLVSEILMLRKILSTKKRAIVILPFISVVAEKTNFMKRVYSAVGLLVEGYYANKGGQSIFDYEEDELNIAVCTIEKANNLLNRAMEEGKIEDFGIVIIDEIHMMGDSSRGYILELLVTKLLYLQLSQLQIVGLSATLPNINIFSTWLGASIYITDFRPVPLVEYVKVGGAIYDKNMNKVKNLEPPMSPKDPDQILDLCCETILEGNSLLIFCSSKRNTELLSVKLASILPEDIYARRSANSEFNVNNFDEKVVKEQRAGLLVHLKRTPGGLDPVFEKTVSKGIAYHHSGLTVEEREIIEFGFRSGVINILIATSTLAAGVNLPARRVIFHTPFIGVEPLDATRYRQMSGRAGRKGIDTLGESYLFCKPAQLPSVKSMVLSELPPLESCLVESRRGMIRPLMDVISGGIVETVQDVERYIMSTLFARQKHYSEVHQVSKAALRFLEENDFVEWMESKKKFAPTKLGKATVASALSPEEGLVVFQELKRARQNLILDTELHLVYQVTPIYHGITPDWATYHNLYTALDNDSLRVADLVSISEGFIIRACRQRPKESKEASIHARFFAALILFDLIREISINSISARYGVPRGHIQALQTTASTFAGMVNAFCHQLKWWPLESLVSQFSDRLCFGVEPDIIPLAQIPHVKGFRARVLYQKGYKTVASIAAAQPDEIEEILRQAAPYKHINDEDTTHVRRIESRIARLIVNGAQQLIGEHTTVLEQSVKKLRDIPKRKPQSPQKRPPKRQKTVNNSTVHAKPIQRPSNLVNQHQRTEQDNLPLTPYSQEKMKATISPPKPVVSPTNQAPVLKPAPKPIVPRATSTGSTMNFVKITHPISRRFSEGMPPSNATDPPKPPPQPSAKPPLQPAKPPPQPSPKPIAALPKPQIGPPTKVPQPSAYPVKASSSTLQKPSIQATVPTSSPSKPIQQLPNGGFKSPPLPPPSESRPIRPVLNKSSTIPAALPSKPTPLTKPPEPMHTAPPPRNQASSKPPIAPLKLPAPPQPIKHPVPIKTEANTIKSPPLANNTGYPTKQTVSYPNKPPQQGIQLKQAQAPPLTSKLTTTTIQPKPQPIAQLQLNHLPLVAQNKANAAPPKVQAAIDIKTEQNQSENNQQTEFTSSPFPTSPFSAPSPPETISKIGNILESAELPFTMVIVNDTFESYEEFSNIWCKQPHFAFALHTSVKEYEPVDYTEWQPKKDKSKPAVKKPIRMTKKLQKLLDDLPHVTNVDGIAVCWNEKQCFYLSLLPFKAEQRANGAAVSGEQLEAYRWDLIRKVMAKSTAYKTAYNMIDKYQLLLECGIRVHKTLQDPRIAAWMIDPEEKNSGSLDCLAERYIPQQKIVGTPGHPFSKAGKETMQAWLLMKYLIDRLKVDVLYLPFRDIEMEVIPILAEMQHWGIGFNMNVCNQHQHQVASTLLVLENEAHKLAGRVFSLTAPAEIGKILFEEFGLPCSKKLSASKKRNIGQRNSTSALVLQQIRHLHPLPSIILQHRKLTTIRIKYMNNLPKYAVFSKYLNMDRIHAAQLHTQTPTGRLAVKNPNLQCIPHTIDFSPSSASPPAQESAPEAHVSASPVSITMRDAFVASPGCILLSADYSQLEVRLMAHFSQDILLLNVFKKGGDVFISLAAEWLDKAPEAVTKEERSHVPPFPSFPLLSPFISTNFPSSFPSCRRNKFAMACYMALGLALWQNRWRLIKRKPNSSRTLLERNTQALLDTWRMPSGTVEPNPTLKQSKEEGDISLILNQKIRLLAWQLKDVLLTQFVRAVPLIWLKWLWFVFGGGWRLIVVLLIFLVIFIRGRKVLKLLPVNYQPNFQPKNKVLFHLPDYCYKFMMSFYSKCLKATWRLSRFLFYF